MKPRFTGLGLLLTAGFLLAALPAAAMAQDAAAVIDAVSSEFSISRESALLRLELADGRTLEAAIRDGAAFVDGRRIGDAPRGGPLDRAWRELLNQTIEVSSSEVPRLLAAWSGPGTVGTAMSTALRAAVQTGADAATGGSSIVVPPGTTSDTVERLMARISELERATQQAERRAERARAAERTRPAARGGSYGPLHYISQGIAGIFSLIITYAVLFAIAFVTIMFGGRKYIEGVGDTARNATGRSMLVGLAACFLVIPAFILGIIALVISIVGIPGLLVWVPGYPVAVVLALMLGYLGVAHAAGESLAERRFYANDWFQRGNSYYFLLSGLGLLIAFFLASQVVYMAGPWLRAVGGIMLFLGFAVTFFALCTGLGAVLLSRGGTRPIRPGGFAEEQEDIFREGAGV
jgi:hypothetical protein